MKGNRAVLVVWWGWGVGVVFTIIRRRTTVDVGRMPKSFPFCFSIKLVRQICVSDSLRVFLFVFSIKFVRQMIHIRTIST